MKIRQSLQISINIIDDESIQRAIKIRNDKKIKHTEVYMKGVEFYEKED